LANKARTLCGMKKVKLPRHVRHKQAKGRSYLYYDTGQRTDEGKAIMVPLPGIDDPTFGRALSMAQGRRKSRANAPQALTVAGLANLFEKSVEFSQFAEKTRSVYSLYLGQLREKLGIAPAGELTKNHVLIIRDRMVDRHGAANQIVRTLGALYKWGRNREHVTNNPVRGIVQLEKGEHAPWPEALVEEALADADPIVRVGVALHYFTAQRIGDVCRMRWDDIRDGAIRVQVQKTGLDLMIPFHERLAAILAGIERDGETILAKARNPWKPELLRRHFQRWAVGRGIKVVAHGLRKNAVNSLLEAGCSAAETAAISGQTLQMIEHYAKKRDQPKLGRAAMGRWNKAGK
jgi:integrase